MQNIMQSMMRRHQKAILPGADMELIDRAVALRRPKAQDCRNGRTAPPTSSIRWPSRRSWRRWGWTTDAILGALLHDCIEDTDASHEDIAQLFGTTVAELVEGVTKLTRANFSIHRSRQQMENLRKMFMAMSKDIRVMLIKIADRLHNMRTMQYQTPEKQIQQVPGDHGHLRAPGPPPWVCRRSNGSWRIPPCKYLDAHGL